jgi:hypothetical protein
MNKLIRVIRHFLHEIVVNFTPPFMRKKMLSCQDVAFILSSGEDLTMTKKFKLKMHLLICQCCTDYESQLNIINHQAQKSIKLELTNEQKQQIEKSQEKVIEKFTKK